MKLTTSDLEIHLPIIVRQLWEEADFKYSRRQISLDSSIQRHLGIDSLGRAELMLRIEKAFMVRLAEERFAKADTLRDLVNIIIDSNPSSKPQLPHSPSRKKTLQTTPIDCSNIGTIIDVLAHYAEKAPDQPHIYWQDNEIGIEKTITFSQLFESAKRIAFSLREGHQFAAGTAIAIMQQTRPEFLFSFVGILMAGYVPVLIYPPQRENQIEDYIKQSAKILQNAQARLLITSTKVKNVSQLLSAFIPTLEGIVTTEALMEQEAPTSFNIKTHLNEIALIQYTSGSASDPKGVLLSHQNFIANIKAVSTALNIVSDDVIVNWLPLYHSLGLLIWLGSLYNGIPFVLFSPLAFLNRPERWLWAIHYYRGTLSGGPNFAYELCARKVEAASIEGLDLSSWRVAVCTSEQVNPSTISCFTNKFSVNGFRPEAFTPMFGITESTAGLILSHSSERLPWIDRVQRQPLEEMQQAIVATDSIEDSNNILKFVSCGKVLPDHEVRIVDPLTHQTLPERHIGNLHFRGPSNMQGYYNSPEATKIVSSKDGWLNSGDLAYQAQGEIFIVGRSKDLIIKAGRNLSPTEIESIVAEAPGVIQNSVIAFGVNDAQRGTERLIIVAEATEKSAALVREISEQISTRIGIIPDEIVLVSENIIPRTANGKLRRSACRTAYFKGQYSKKPLPLWLQRIKIGTLWAAAKLTSYLRRVIAILYSIYVIGLLLITGPFAWLSALCGAQLFATRTCRAWARFMSFLGLGLIRILGEPLPKSKEPHVYIANHTSYLDVFLLFGILPKDTYYVAKKELFTIPILRTFLKTLNGIPVDRIDPSESLKLAGQITELLKQGKSICIFPEATFNYVPGLRPFKLGAFKAAAEANVPVCPITISGLRNVMTDRTILLTPNRVKVTVGKCFKAKTDSWQDVAQLKNIVRSEVAKNGDEPTLDMIAAGPS